MRSMNLTVLFASLLSCLTLSCRQPEIVQPETPGQREPSPQPELTLESPDGQIQVEITVGTAVSYRVFRNEQALTAELPLSMTLSDGRVWGRGSTLSDTRLSHVSEKIRSPFYIRSEVDDRYNGAVHTFAEGFEVEFRAYDDAVAYRFRSTGNGDFTVMSEEIEYRFPRSFTMTAAPSPGGTGSKYENACNCFESYYQKDVRDFPSGRMGLLPVLVSTGGQKLCIAEAGVRGYPAMFLTKGSGNSLAGFQTRVVKETSRNEYTVKVPKSWESCIAKCSGAMDFPWRIFMVIDSDAQLLDNDMIYRLAPSCELQDISWIKGGMSTWDWETSFTLDDVNFSSGRNIETYKYHIDYAVKTGIPYITIDAGCIPTNGSSYSYAPYLVPSISYANEKGIGVWVWMEAAWFSDVLLSGNTERFETLFRDLSAIGVKGIKIDFFERNDQEYIDLQWKIAEEAAKNRLMLNYHSSPIPHGMNRTYPNVVSYEAVRGLEHMKYGNWDVVAGSGPADQVTYDVTFPFLRGMTGPVDYTPGLMRNAFLDQWSASDPRPMSMGTRCRQLAAFILFFSPVGTMADNITTYEKNAECAGFIASVPTVWDETVPVKASLGEYIVIARRSGDDWFVAGMTDWTRRNMTIDLPFLDGGDWEAEVFEDTSGAATSYHRSVKTVDGTRMLNVKMQGGGGFAVHLKRK